MKKLLQDVTTLSYNVLDERTSGGPGDGRVTVEGIFQHEGVKNRNGRVYPKGMWAKHLRPGAGFGQRIQERRVFGQLEHPEDGKSRIGLAAFVIESAKVLGDGRVKGVLTTTTNEHGKNLASLFRDGLTVGISSRGKGSVKTEHYEGIGEVEVVQSDFVPETFDVVADPSTPGAEVVKEAHEIVAALVESGETDEATLLAEDGRNRLALQVARLGELHEAGEVEADHLRHRVADLRYLAKKLGVLEEYKDRLKKLDEVVSISIGVAVELEFSIPSEGSDFGHEMKKERKVRDLFLGYDTITFVYKGTERQARSFIQAIADKVGVQAESVKIGSKGKLEEQGKGVLDVEGPRTFEMSVAFHHLFDPDYENEEAERDKELAMRALRRDRNVSDIEEEPELILFQLKADSEKEALRTARRILRGLAESTSIKVAKDDEDVNEAMAMMKRSAVAVGLEFTTSGESSDFAHEMKKKAGQPGRRGRVRDLLIEPKVISFIYVGTERQANSFILAIADSVGIQVESVRIGSKDGFDEAGDGSVDERVDESDPYQLAYRVPGKGGWKRASFKTEAVMEKFIDKLIDKEGDDVETRISGPRESQEGLIAQVAALEEENANLRALNSEMSRLYKEEKREAKLQELYTAHPELKNASQILDREDTIEGLEAAAAAIVAAANRVSNPTDEGIEPGPTGGMLEEGTVPPDSSTSLKDLPRTSDLPEVATPPQGSTATGGSAPQTKKDQMEDRQRRARRFRARRR